MAELYRSCRPANDPRLMTYNSYLDSFLLPYQSGRSAGIDSINTAIKKQRSALKKKFTLPGEPGHMFRRDQNPRADQNISWHRPQFRKITSWGYVWLPSQWHHIIDVPSASQVQTLRYHAYVPLDCYIWCEYLPNLHGYCRTVPVQLSDVISFCQGCVRQIVQGVEAARVAPAWWSPVFEWLDAYSSGLLQSADTSPKSGIPNWLPCTVVMQPDPTGPSLLRYCFHLNITSC